MWNTRTLRLILYESLLLVLVKRKILVAEARYQPEVGKAGKTFSIVCFYSPYFLIFL